MPAFVAANADFERGAYFVTLYPEWLHVLGVASLGLCTACSVVLLVETIRRGRSL
jgi:hypothetical protein